MRLQNGEEPQEPLTLVLLLRGAGEAQEESRGPTKASPFPDHLCNCCVFKENKTFKSHRQKPHNYIGGFNLK